MFWVYVYLGGLVVSAIIITILIQIENYHKQDLLSNTSDDMFMFYWAGFFWPIIAPIAGIALTIWLIYTGIGKVVFYLLNKFSNQSVVASSQNIQNDSVEVVNLGNVIATAIPQNKTIEKKSNKKANKNQTEVKTKEELF